MASAGLTRGGFYAHFKSKDELILEVMKGNSGLVRWLTERPSAAGDELLSEAAGCFRTYLDPDKRDAVASSCLLASMLQEASRGSKAMRRAYASRFKIVIDELERSFRTEDTEIRRRAVLAAVLAIGSLNLSLAMDAGNFSDEIERISLEEIERLLLGNP
jgi:TetR/AcrR family transcriptional repressor of nem operon